MSDILIRLPRSRLPAPPPVDPDIYDRTKTHDAIRARRQPLPSHALTGVNYRQWAAAVCAAEAQHAQDDFWHVARTMRGPSMFDRDDGYDHHVPYQFVHEAHAGAALNWLSHLQAHDSDRRGVWARWHRWSLGRRVWWLQRRRYLLHGFLHEAKAYEAARHALLAKVA